MGKSNATACRCATMRCLDRKYTQHGSKFPPAVCLLSLCVYIRSMQRLTSKSIIYVLAYTREEKLFGCPITKLLISYRCGPLVSRSCGPPAILLYIQMTPDDFVYYYTFNCQHKEKCHVTSDLSISRVTKRCAICRGKNTFHKAYRCPSALLKDGNANIASIDEITTKRTQTHKKLCSFGNAATFSACLCWKWADFCVCLRPTSKGVFFFYFFFSRNRTKNLLTPTTTITA